MKMNYESIAELVHNLVKNPKNMMAREHGFFSAEIKTNELTIIQKVFSNYEVSGDALTIGVIPEGLWG